MQGGTKEERACTITFFGCTNLLSARAARRRLPCAPGALSSQLYVTKARTNGRPMRTGLQHRPELTYVPWKPPDPPGPAGGRGVLSPSSWPAALLKRRRAPAGALRELCGSSAGARAGALRFFKPDPPPLPKATRASRLSASPSKAPLFSSGWKKNVTGLHSGCSSRKDTPEAGRKKIDNGRWGVAARGMSHTPASRTLVSP